MLAGRGMRRFTFVRMIEGEQGLRLRYDVFVLQMNDVRCLEVGERILVLVSALSHLVVEFRRLNRTYVRRVGTGYAYTIVCR